MTCKHFLIKTNFGTSGTGNHGNAEGLFRLSEGRQGTLGLMNFTDLAIPSGVPMHGWNHFINSMRVLSSELRSSRTSLWYYLKCRRRTSGSFLSNWLLALVTRSSNGRGIHHFLIYQNYDIQSMDTERCKLFPTITCFNNILVLAFVGHAA